MDKIIDYAIMIYGGVCIDDTMSADLHFTIDRCTCHNHGSLAYLCSGGHRGLGVSKDCEMHVSHVARLSDSLTNGIISDGYHIGARARATIRHGHCDWIVQQRFNCWICIDQACYPDTAKLSNLQDIFSVTTCSV